MNPTHLHLVLNHFPTIGMVVGIGLYLLAFFKQNDDLKRASLAIFVVLMMMAIPTFLSGYAAREAIAERPDLPTALLQAHMDAALLSLIVMGITGVVAWVGLWQFRPTSRPTRGLLSTVLVLSIVTLALMGATANIGGELSHQEIRAGQAAATMPVVVSAEAVTRFMNGPWVVWATTETFHFIGLSLLSGVALIVNLRLLGMMKSVPFAALDRLLPWGVLGFGINVVSGLLFFIGDPTQYTKNPAFVWKMILLLPAVGTVLYVTISETIDRLGAGEDAPLIAKVVAVASLVLWAAVLYFGRMLPYLGMAF